MQEAMNRGYQKLVETVFDGVAFAPERYSPGTVKVPFPIAQALMDARPEWFSHESGKEMVSDDNLVLGDGVIYMRFNGLNKWRYKFAVKFIREYVETHNGRPAKFWTSGTWRNSPASESYWSA